MNWNLSEVTRRLKVFTVIMFSINAASVSRVAINHYNGRLRAKIISSFTHLLDSSSRSPIAPVLCAFWINEDINLTEISICWWSICFSLYEVFFLFFLLFHLAWLLLLMLFLAANVFIHIVVAFVVVCCCCCCCCFHS